MRILCLTILLSIASASVALAHGPSVVVHLRNGGTVYGELMEEIPGEHVRVQLADGSSRTITASELASVETRSEGDAPESRSKGVDTRAPRLSAYGGLLASTWSEPVNPSDGHSRATLTGGLALDFPAHRILSYGVRAAVSELGPDYPIDILGTVRARYAWQVGSSVPEVYGLGAVGVSTSLDETRPSGALAAGFAWLFAQHLGLALEGMYTLRGSEILGQMLALNLHAIAVF